MTFAEARAFLLAHRTDYTTAYAGFRWPDETRFNWALDWFDSGLAADPATRDRAALRIVDAASGEETAISFAAMAHRSGRAANFLRASGVRRGDRLLLLLGNVSALWEVMLAAAKLGAVVIPATTLLTAEEIADRVTRGGARFAIAGPAQAERLAALDGTVRILVGGAPPPGWRAYAPDEHPAEFVPDGPTGSDDPLLLYFTSGTTAKPKLVLHTHRSYPVGSLSTMYWLGLQPGDVHLNISSPGWAKHAWSSVFAPWNAGATVLVVNQPRFQARGLLDAIVRCGATTLCAPPTVWRLLVQEDLPRWRTSLRELAAAGEPLNPEIIAQVQAAWGLPIRDGYGQTETTAQIGNTPGQPVVPGGMGRPLPGYHVRLVDAEGHDCDEGELSLEAGPGQRPAGLMAGYQDPEGGLVGADAALFRTGDVALREADGALRFVGRADDVFKSSGYRISPFELESALIEHPEVAEAAVVPAPDPIRLAVPKAFVALRPGARPDRAQALSVFRHAHAHLAPYKRVRRLEFVAELPKTISGKIRRVQLRAAEHGAEAAGWERGPRFVEEEFPELGRE